MKRIRSGYGIGDNLYLQSICRHLLDRGVGLEVCTDWPDLFLPLKDRIRLQPFTRSDIDIIAHYVQAKSDQRFDQFHDMCVRAGIDEPVDLRLDWEIQNPSWLTKFAGKRIVLVLLPREPMNRKDRYGRELLPDCSVIDRCLEHVDGFRVQVGSGKPLYRLKNIDCDLSGKTTITQLVDLASIADLFVGYVSFFVPLSESFRKRAFFVWSQKGLMSQERYIHTITPKKILHRPAGYVVDSWEWDRIREVLNATCSLSGGRGEVPGEESRHRRISTLCSGERARIH